MMILTNPVSGDVKQVDLETFLSNFDHTVHKEIKTRLAREDVTGVMMFENLMLGARNCGQKTAMIFGPGCTYQTAELAAKGWLNDLPSQRQYPQNFYVKP